MMSKAESMVMANNAAAMQKTFRISLPRGYAELRIEDGKLTFNGDADTAAKVFLDKVALRYNIQWNRMRERLERTERVQHAGRIHFLVSELLADDSVPLSDSWKTALDGIARLEHQQAVNDELDMIKTIRGWRYIDMCMYCGTVKTIEEITAAGGLSCCPERRMVKTLVPAGYQDQKK